MFFILPLSHEHTVVKRLPVITLSLIIVNTIVYIFTAIHAPQSSERLFDAKTTVFQYYYNHPYLELPPESKDKLFSSHPDLMEEIDRLSYNQPSKLQVEYYQMILDQAVDEYEEAFKSEFYRKYGYIPARGSILTTLTSMFLHGDFFHLLFNMLFLFLSGYILEDHWGRVIYLLFYMSAGMIATWTHGAVFPQSYIPLVGASGAVAGLMGAFLVRFFKTRIYFFYFILIVIKFWTGRFLAPAYIMLSLWLGQQVISAFLDDGTGAGVAFWAHIGGFAYGFGFALMFKFMKIEEKFISHAIDKKVTMFDATAHNVGQSIKNLAENTEDNGFVRKLRAQQFLDMGDRNKALFECKRALVTLIKDNEHDVAMDYYSEMAGKFPELSLKQDYQFKLVDMYEENHRLKEAARACKNLAYMLKELGDSVMMNQAVKRYKRIAQDYQKTAGVKQTTKGQTAADSAIIRKPDPQGGQQNRNPSTNQWNGVALVETLNRDEVELLKTVEPRFVMRVTGCSEQGLSFQGTNRDMLGYEEIKFATVYQVDGETKLFMDLFVKGEMRPFRLNSAGIAYGEIFSESSANMLESFRRFVVFLLKKPSVVFTDLGTQSFALNKAPQFYVSETKVKEYERKIWSGLINQ